MAGLGTLGLVRPELSLPEWTVLAVVSEQPAHGFAIAALTAPGGELGRVWQIPRPVIYRALGRLLDSGLVAPGAVESARGPQRTLYSATEQGREAVHEWLGAPVDHVREVRSHLLLKLALLDRLGIDPADLLRRQKAVLQPIARAVAADRPHGQDSGQRGEGFDAVLGAWRRATAAATLSFLDDLTRSDPRGA
jgi:DNA-binding PadR family transcriptional regulator